jgi:hypothetical protein
VGCISEAMLSLCLPQLFCTSQESEENGCSVKPHATGCLTRIRKRYSVNLVARA